MSPQEKNSIRVKLDKSEILSETAARYKHSVCDTNNVWGDSLQLLAVEHQCFKIQLLETFLFVLLIPSELKLLSCHFPKIGKLI